METKQWTYLYDGDNPSYTIGKNINKPFYFVKKM